MSTCAANMFLRLSWIALVATGLACHKSPSDGGRNRTGSDNAAPAARSEPAMTQAANPIVIMETSKGTLKIELDQAKAPKSVANFLAYVDEGFYNGTIFHRVIPDFMVQGGGFTPDMKQKAAHDPVANEAGNGLKNMRGTLAMARTSVVDSATAQFFINVTDNAFLNHRDDSASGFGYAVFGKVIDGMDIVDKIKSVKTTSSGQYDNVPAEAVIIKSVKRQ